MNDPVIGVTSAAFGLAYALKSLKPEKFRHTSCYCEENVWRLCEDLLYGRSEEAEEGTQRIQVAGSSSSSRIAERAGERESRQPNALYAGRLKVVFISNDERSMPLWHQKAGANRVVLGETGFVMWDYHVIAVLDLGEFGCHVLDLDTDLGFIPLEDYVDKALRPDVVEACASRRQLSRRMFRVIPAEEYLETLCTDRSHMKDERTGRYSMPPPHEPPIVCSKAGCHHGTNLMRDFVAMEPGAGPGEVLNEQAFLRQFKAHSVATRQCVAA